MKLLLFIVPRIWDLSSFEATGGAAPGSCSGVDVFISQIPKNVNIQMIRPTHAMTLRLSPEIAEAIENRAFERGCSQADWIRTAIRKSLVEVIQDEMRQLVSVATRPDSVLER